MVRVRTSEPSSRNKTGGWRDEKPVVTEKCTGCMICVNHCPEGCIEMKEKRATIDYDYCKGCMICMEICPVKAIKKEEESK